ncbi:MAG: PTS sugar transporter subunit IIB [Mycoplasma sp.]
MKVLLACSAGMSTSLLEKSLQDYAIAQGFDIDVIAKSSGEAKEVLHEYDICLLGPQVKFMEAAFKEVAGSIPVVIIPPHIYAMANGAECFKLIEAHIKK